MKCVNIKFHPPFEPSRPNIGQEVSLPMEERSHLQKKKKKRFVSFESPSSIGSQHLPREKRTFYISLALMNTLTAARPGCPDAQVYSEYDVVALKAREATCSQLSGLWEGEKKRRQRKQFKCQGPVLPSLLP